MTADQGRDDNRGTVRREATNRPGRLAGEIPSSARSIFAMGSSQPEVQRAGSIVAPKINLSPFSDRFEYFLSFERVAGFYLGRYEKLLQH